MSIDFDKFLADLSTQSEDEFIDPNAFQWPASAEADAWYFSPELISLHGRTSSRSNSASIL